MTGIYETRLMVSVKVNGAHSHYEPALSSRWNTYAEAETHAYLYGAQRERGSKRVPHLNGLKCEWRCIDPRFPVVEIIKL